MKKAMLMGALAGLVHEAQAEIVPSKLSEFEYVSHHNLLLLLISNICVPVCL